MISMKLELRAWLLASLITCTLAPGDVLRAQEENAAAASRDTLIAVARQIIDAARFCTLITLDESGRPAAREMDPFSPEADMVIWLGTDRRSRKVQHIRKDPRVTLYYAAPDGSGYVSLSGAAELVDDAEEKAVRWKEGWESYYADREANYLLIKVVPEKMEILSYAHGIVGDPDTWRVPVVEFRSGESPD
jgi:general stress protein 26